MLKSGLLLIAIALLMLLSGCAHKEDERKYITIMGAVNRPGDYFVNSKVPYILILLEARGYTEFADSTQVIVERNSKSVILDLSIPESQQPPHLAEKFMVYPYDVITVPKKKQ
jgi:protein involved in polysaccharide export with SLBB domain